MYFDRFDVCEAYYVYALQYHGGQWSPEYRIFGRLAHIHFSCPSVKDEGSLSENGRAIYDNLVKRHQSN